MTASLKTDPFLWIHLAGIAIAPVALQIVWIAIGSTPPMTLYWLEFFTVAISGIVPILLMQWYRPFCIYSVLILCLKPEQLTLQQQKTLSLFKRKSQAWASLVTALIMLLILWLIYQWAPLTTVVIHIELPSRLAIILIAAIAFFFSNLFIQVPVSVFLVLLTNSQTLTNTQPPINIAQEFTIFGIRVNKILPIEWSK